MAIETPSELLALLDPVQVMTQRAAVGRVVIEEVHPNAGPKPILPVDSPYPNARIVGDPEIPRTMKVVGPVLEFVELPILLEPLEQVPPDGADERGGKVAKILLPDERLGH